MRFFAIVGALFISGNPAMSQELRPLGDLIGDAAIPYAPTRCAGLYQALMEWSGFDRMGEETWSQTDGHRENFIWFAVLVSQSLGGGTLEQQAENVVRDVRNIADLYLDRMEGNYTVQGQAFGDDALIIGDIELCAALAQTLQ
jgi:hypothetical protein